MSIDPDAQYIIFALSFCFVEALLSNQRRIAYQ